MEFYNVKNKVTERVTVMSKEVYDNLCLNKNLHVPETEEKDSKLVHPFEIVSNVESLTVDRIPYEQPKK